MISASLLGKGGEGGVSCVVIELSLVVFPSTNSLACPLLSLTGNHHSTSTVPFLTPPSNQTFPATFSTLYSSRYLPHFQLHTYPACSPSSYASPAPRCYDFYHVDSTRNSGFRPRGFGGRHPAPQTIISPALRVSRSWSRFDWTRAGQPKNEEGREYRRFLRRRFGGLGSEGWGRPPFRASRFLPPLARGPTTSYCGIWRVKYIFEQREVKLMKMVVVIKVYKTKFLNTNLLPSRRARMANSARLPRHLTHLSRLPTSPSYAPSFIKAYNFQFGSLISRSVEYGDDCGDNIQTVPDLQPLQRHQIPRDLRHREERPPHAKAISRKYLVIMKPCSLPMTTIVLPAMRTRLNPPPPKRKYTSGRTNEGFPRSTEGNNGNLGFLKQQIPILSLNSSEILKPLDADAFQS